jgi:hypothetical protein
MKVWTVVESHWVDGITTRHVCSRFSSRESAEQKLQEVQQNNASTLEDCWIDDPYEE